MSMSGSLGSQNPGPPVLIHMFLESSLIFLRLSFPICEMMIVAFIERGGYKDTKQALPQGRGSNETTGSFASLCGSPAQVTTATGYSGSGKIGFITPGKYWHFMTAYYKNMKTDMKTEYLRNVGH